MPIVVLSSCTASRPDAENAKARSPVVRHSGEPSRPTTWTTAAEVRYASRDESADHAGATRATPVAIRRQPPPGVVTNNRPLPTLTASTTAMCRLSGDHEIAAATP